MTNVIERDFGIRLGEGQVMMLGTRLRTAARQLDLDSGDALADLFCNDPDGPLVRRAAGMLVNTETSFFRDNHPWTALRQEVLPQLIERLAHGEPLRVWSAASSTGQEVYSLAMMLSEHFPALVDAGRVEIRASDHSTVALEQAVRGRYSSLEVSRGLPAPLLVRFFDRDGIGWRVNSSLRAMINFDDRNITTGPWSDLPAFDLVLLRNVLIYFDDDVREKALNGVVAHLRPGGYLLCGTAETATARHGVHRVILGSTVLYKRVDNEGRNDAANR